MTLDPDDWTQWVTPHSTQPVIRVHVFEDGIHDRGSHWMRVPRIPVPGDRITGPDDDAFPPWTVESVSFDYEQGTYHEPVVNVRVSQ